MNNAPYGLGGSIEWDTTEVGRADALFDWTFDHGGFPVAELEIWWKSENGTGWVWTLLTTIASSQNGHRHGAAFGPTDTWGFYKLRYKNGDTLGPFSADLEIVE